MQLDKVELGIIVAGIVACIGIFAYVFYIKNNATSQVISYATEHRSSPETDVILRQINNNIESQIPMGDVTDENIDVTQAITDLYSPTDGLPWTSFSVTNNGPDGVYVVVNEWRSPESPIAAGETLSIDLKQRGAIKRVYLKCNHGETANVDIHAIQ